MSGFTRHRRSGRVIANFTGFEADLLRSLASQLVELLRNEARRAARRRRPARGAAGLLRARPPSPRTRCSPGCSRRRTPTTRRPPREFRRFTEGALRDGKAAPRSPIIDAPRGGRAAARADRGRAGDRRRARRADRRDLDALVHRHAARAGHPARGRGGRRGLLGTRCPTTTRAPRPTTSTSGSATSRRRWSRRSPREAAAMSPIPDVRRRDPQDDRPPRDVAARRHGGRHARRRDPAGPARRQRRSGRRSPASPSPGRSPAVAAAREALEETGVAVSVDRLASTTAHPGVVHANGDRAVVPRPDLRLHLARGRGARRRRRVERRAVVAARRAAGDERHHGRGGSTPPPAASGRRGSSRPRRCRRRGATAGPRARPRPCSASTPARPAGSGS